MCRISLSEGWKGCCYGRRRRSSFVAGIQPQDLNTYFTNIYFLTVIIPNHIYVCLLQIANNTGYIQVDWKRVEKDVDKAKRQLKKNTDKAVPELNTFMEKVFFCICPTARFGHANWIIVHQKCKLFWHTTPASASLRFPLDCDYLYSETPINSIKLSTRLFFSPQSTDFVKKNIVVTSGFVGGFLLGLAS